MLSRPVVQSSWLPSGSQLLEDGYSANPLACAAANATLGLLLEKNFFNSLNLKMNKMKEEGERFERHAWCGEFRQTGMIAAVELVQDRETKKPFPVEQRVGYEIYLKALERGLFLRPLGDVVYFIPPLVIEPEEIETMMQTAEECIVSVLGES